MLPKMFPVAFCVVFAFGLAAAVVPASFAGPDRVIKLSSALGDEGFGLALIVKTDQEVKFFFDVYGLACQEQKNASYVLYLFLDGERSRLQSFNTDCANSAHRNYRDELSPGIGSLPRLLTDDFCVEVWRELDDGNDGPDFPDGSSYAVLKGCSARAGQ